MQGLGTTTITTAAIAGGAAAAADAVEPSTAPADSAAAAAANPEDESAVPCTPDSLPPLVAPATPLEQRQWQRMAQRTIRLAATTFKDAGTRLLNATAQGTTDATQLTNCILSERYMPTIELPEALKSVQGLQQAAVDKLKRKQQQQLQQLQKALVAMSVAVQEMDAAVADIDSISSPPAKWQLNLAVFHSLTLPESRDMLLQVLDMYRQELQSKQGLYESYKQLVELGSSSSSSSGSSSGGNSRKGDSVVGSKPLSVDDLRSVLTAAVTTWMVRPHIDDGKIEHLLQVLTDEMVGF